MRRRPFQPHLFPALLMTFAIYAVSVSIRDAEAATNSVEHKKLRRNQKGPGGSQISVEPFTINEPAFRKEILKNEGDDVQIHCSQNRTNWNSCVWYKVNSQDGKAKRITQFFHRYQRIDSCRLQIQAVTYEDAGTILCKASSGSSMITNFTTQLTVTGPDDPYGNNLPKPSAKIQPQSYAEPEIFQNLLPQSGRQFAHVGENILLKCKAAGYPPPLISWKRGSKNYTSLSPGESNLKLTNLTKEDGGTYKCEAVNIFGKATADVLLQVDGALQGASEILDVTPRNITLYEGGYGNLTCIARFEGDPWFVWVKKIDNRTGGMNTFTYEGHDYSVQPKTEIRPFGPHLFATTLLLQNVTMATAGKYHCIVAGLQGYNHSEAYVMVEEDPSKLHMAQLRRHKAITVLWIIAFVVFAALVILCIIRVYGCPKVDKNKHSSRMSLPSDPSSNKTELHKGSPRTLSTDCTTNIRQDVYTPLPTHTHCSVTSHEFSELLKQDCASSCRTYNSYDPEYSVEGSDRDNTCYVMADLDAARSSYSFAESSCDSEFCSQQSFTSPADCHHQQMSGQYEPCDRKQSNIRWIPGNRPYSNRFHHKQQHPHHPQFYHQITKCEGGEFSHSVVPAASLCSCNSDSCNDEQNSQVSLVYVV